MDNVDPRRSARASISDLVDDLHALRDALVNVSLALQEYRFHFDDVERQAAAQRAVELVEKIKLR